MPSRCTFDPAYWEYYRSANERFAQTLAHTCQAGDYLWVHDYHLMSTGAMLREHGYQGDIGFFLHIPFPADEIFLQMPWRRQIIRDLAAFDLIGFQTQRDRRNFLACMRMLFPGTQVVGKGHVVSVRIPLDHNWRRLRAGVFPISIDYRALAERSRSEPVATFARRIRADLKGRNMVLGVDRLDYSKGLPHRLRAFRCLLRRHPELHEKITLIQHVVPSRGSIPEYEKLRREIDYLVSEINAEFTTSGWVPIHYVSRSLQIDELVAYFRAADVMLVTSLKDGMNLVAKEFVACQVERDGVLILSEFAGAAAQLQKGAMLVNPHDEVGVAECLFAAVHMSTEERRMRMQKLRRAVREFDIFRWVDAFLGAAIDKDLNHFPLQADFIPLNDWAEVM
jgi:trehalose 6-phosphate synthase